MRSWIRHFLPFGLVRASQLASAMAAVGVDGRHALDAKAPYRWKQLNFDLLPDGALREPRGRIVDVGSNAGDWAADVLWLCPAARLTCIEPDPRLARQLRDRFAGRPGVEVLETAAGDKAGTIDFRIMEDSVFNSARSPAAGVAAHYPATFRVLDTLAVPVQTLDALLPGPERIALLKIDVQGFEREVLAGATRTLGRSDHVLMEVNFRPHYEGEADFFELTRIMQQHGFSIGNYSGPKGGRKQALYADVLFVPSTA